MAKVLKTKMQMLILMTNVFDAKIGNFECLLLFHGVFMTILYLYFSTYNNADIEWTAPENPSFIVDGMSMNDIKQNGIGDCWFLASLASLAQRNERVSFVIQKQRNEEAQPDQGKN